MKKLALLSTIGVLVLALFSSCQTKSTPDDPVDPIVQEKLDAFAPFKLTTDLSGLSANEKEMLPHLIKAAEQMEIIFWKQAYGDREELMRTLRDPASREFAKINYGPWERLMENTPFVEGFEEKPLGSQLYPIDMTKDEFNNWEDETKSSLYTLIQRNKEGDLESIPYHIAFEKETKIAVKHIRQAAELAEDEGLKKYLELRADALLTDDYLASDMAWMDMKTNSIDFVVGPIENYEDALFGYKAAHESYVLIKDKEWSAKLARFAALLPELQKSLPVPDEYKAEVPGSGSDMGVYDAIYYAGDCNAGSKTIAINLPNDERVHLEKGSRKLQLKNSMKAKFDQILVPIANELMAEDQRKHITFDAFFENTMFHEVSHGLGIKNTINGKGPVRKVLSDQYSAFEEGKADIAGLFMITKLAEMGEFGEKDLMDNYVTFMAGIFRSVRFGASSSHGKANMVRFNYFQEKGAFTRDSNTGTYSVDFVKMTDAMIELTKEILIVQGNGDYDKAKKILTENGYIKESLQADLDRLKEKGIPKDIVFIQGIEALGL